MYAQKKRAIIPKYYSEEKDRKPVRQRLNNRSTKISKLKDQIRIKAERLSNLKTAIRVYNQQLDKRELEDVDLYDELIDDEQMNMEGNEAESSIHTSPEDPEESVCIIDDDWNGPTQMLPGVEPIEVDQNLSLNYTYTTDVSKIN